MSTEKDSKFWLQIDSLFPFHWLDGLGTNYFVAFGSLHSSILMQLQIDFRDFYEVR
jgi:hypothetical protein